MLATMEQMQPIMAHLWPQDSLFACDHRFTANMNPSQIEKPLHAILNCLLLAVIKSIFRVI
jgi:hypothetical protein